MEGSEKTSDMIGPVFWQDHAAVLAWAAAEEL